MTLEEKLDKEWLWMKDKWPEINGSLDFSSGLWQKYEGYKYDIFDNASRALDSAAIRKATPGQGEITNYALNCLDCGKGKGDDGALVHWSGVDYLRKRGSSLAFETAILNLLAGPAEQDIVPIFNELRGAVNSNFQIAAFLFFARDRQRFLPISQEIFDRGFSRLGLKFKTSGKGGAEYLEFIKVSQQIARWLKAKRAKSKDIGDSLLLDAHSYLYWLGRLDEQREKQNKGVGLYAEKPTDVHSESPDLGNLSSHLMDKDQFDYSRNAIVEDLNAYVEFYGVVEGRNKYELHAEPERKASVVASKKNLVRKEKGSLACEICSFDFQQTFGELGDGFIECHHIDPISSRPAQGSLTRVDQLALLCSNCHRMIHRRNPMLSLDELREIIMRYRDS